MSELSNAPLAPDTEEEGLAFLIRYLQVLFIHKWIFVSVFVVVFAGVVLFALKQPKVYNAQYEVFYNETIREYMDESDVPVVKSDFDKNFWLSNMLSGEIARMTVLYSGLSYSQEETQVLSLQKVIADLERMTLPDTTDGVHQQLLRNREMVYMTIKQLNSKLIEAQSTARGSLSRFVTIDEASTPVNSATKGLSFFMLVAFVLAAALGAGAVFVYDMLDNRLMVQSDFERFYALPVLGALPRIKRKGEGDWLTEGPGDKGYEGWAELSSAAVGVRQAMKYSDKRLIAVCSSVRQEGKSLISWQLARSLADKNVRVLLVATAVTGAVLADSLAGVPAGDSLVGVGAPGVAARAASPASAGATSPMRASSSVSVSKQDSEWLDTVTIEQGTRLTLLAQKYYGNKVFWVYIYMANNEVIANPNQVAVGTKVRIPAPGMYGIDAADKVSVKEATAYQSKILAGDWTPVASN